MFLSGRKNEMGPFPLSSSFPWHLWCPLWPRGNRCLLDPFLPHPLNNVLSILEGKEKDLSKHEIPEQFCLFLRDLFTFPEAFGDTQKKEQVIIISILLVAIFSYFSLHAGCSNTKVSLLNSDYLSVSLLPISFTIP